VIGQPVTFAATVAPTSGTGTPTGMVTFSDSATTLATVALTSGTATFTTSSQEVREHRGRQIPVALADQLIADAMKVQLALAC
jgi:hypothetical protein